MDNPSMRTTSAKAWIVDADSLIAEVEFLTWYHPKRAAESRLIEK
jgi:hypothetical protein